MAGHPPRAAAVHPLRCRQSPRRAAPLRHRHWRHRRRRTGLLLLHCPRPPLAHLLRSRCHPGCRQTHRSPLGPFGRLGPLRRFLGPRHRSRLRRQTALGCSALFRLEGGLRLLLLLGGPLHQQGEVFLRRLVAGQAQLGRRDSLIRAAQAGLLQNVVDRGIDGVPPYPQPIGGRFLAQQAQAPLAVAAPDVDRLVQHHERQMLQVPALQERRVEVQPAILIHGHRAQPRPFHGNERHHLMRHVGHFAGGQYPALRLVFGVKVAYGQPV